MGTHQKRWKRWTRKTVLRPQCDGNCTSPHPHNQAAPKKQMKNLQTSKFYLVSALVLQFLKTLDLNKKRLQWRVNGCIFLFRYQTQ